MSIPELASSVEAIQQHLNVLCADIGTRVAATDAELAAAVYAEDYLRGLGLTNVTRHLFPFTAWGY
ncbi:MAG: hypothetical protein AB7Y46_17925, partial [Armatimonadota bacterium]